MGLFACKVCEGNLLGVTDHVCDRGKALAHVERLERRATDAEDKLRDIHNAVYQLMKDVPTLDDEYAVVSTEWLRRLWEGAQCCWDLGAGETPDSFLAGWLANQFVLCAAFDLFRTKSKGHPSKSTLEKLRELRERCEQASRTHGYDKAGGTEFDLTPEFLAGGGER